MNARENLLSAAVPALLAVLFPFYWVIFLGQSLNGFEDAFKQDLLLLNWRDGLFVFIGVLEVLVYVNLSNHLKYHFNANAARLMLFIMASLVAIFHLTVLFDVYFSISQQSSLSENIVIAAMTISLGSLGLFTLVALVFSIVCLLNKQLPSLLKAFCALMLLMCLLQMTVFLSFTNVFIFPAALLILSIYFVKEKESLEVI